MTATSKLLRSSAAALAALFLVAGPVAAAEDPAAPEGGDGSEAVVGDHGEGTSDRYQIAETPRQQVGLLLLGALGVGSWLAASNARRQLKGERPQATGEFRWR